MACPDPKDARTDIVGPIGPRQGNRQDIRHLDIDIPLIVEPGPRVTGISIFGWATTLRLVRLAWKKHGPVRLAHLVYGLMIDWVPRAGWITMVSTLEIDRRLVRDSSGEQLGFVVLC